MIEQKDVKTILELCKEFHSESRMKDVPLDLPTCWDTITKYMNHSNGFVRFDRDKQGEIVGMFIGCKVPLFFSKESQAQDIVFYVRPEHRGGSWIFRVIKEFEVWAKKQGASKVILYHDTGINTKQAPKFMDKVGYTQTGFCFSKDITCVV